MATDGHPYFTKELDERRSAQRRVLAGISERTLDSAGIPRKPAPPAELSGRVETIIRLLAQPLIDDARSEVLDRPAQAGDKRALATWLRSFDLNNWAGRVGDMLVEESHVGSGEDMAVADLVNREYDVLAKIATLLVWADDLAGDYVDPRISQWRQPPAETRRGPGHAPGPSSGLRFARREIRHPENPLMEFAGEAARACWRETGRTLRPDQPRLTLGSLRSFGSRFAFRPSRPSAPRLSLLADWPSRPGIAALGDRIDRKSRGDQTQHRGRDDDRLPDCDNLGGGG